MQARISKEEENRLREAKWRFLRWRQGRRRSGWIPSELWMLAAETAAEHGIDQTASQLQVDAQRLEPWVEGVELSCYSDEPRLRRSSSCRRCRWPPPVNANWRSKVRRAISHKLPMFLKGAAVVQLAAVLSTLGGKELLS